MENASTKPGIPGADEDDWEYEYHPTDTETFYFTIDLSSAPGGTQDGSSNYYFHSKLARPVPQESSGNGKTTTQQAGDIVQNTEGTATSTSPTTDAKDHIQILGLESKEPILSYQGQVYRCSWNTTLGTDMIFTAPDDVTPDIEPLLKDPRFNLLTTTNMKLVAEPVVLEEKEYGDDVANAQWNEDGTGQQAESSASQNPAKSYSILLEHGASTSKKRQATFLEELMAVKAARLETDEVYIGRKKEYKVQGENETREGRHLSIEGDVDEEEAVQEVEGSVRIIRTNRRQRGGRKSGPRGANISSAGGGLFRDFALHPEVGEDQWNGRLDADANSATTTPSATAQNGQPESTTVVRLELQQDAAQSH